MAVESHRKEGEKVTARCAVITISDTRTETTDKSGAVMCSMLTDAGHEVMDYRIVPDEPREIRPVLLALIAKKTCDVILTNGGTGISARDRTFDVVDSLLDKRLDGFGELFRMLSFEEIGPAAMLSRAVAGIHGDTVIISTPGSSAAVKLAMERLIIPELGHIIQQVRA